MEKSKIKKTASSDAQISNFKLAAKDLKTVETEQGNSNTQEAKPQQRKFSVKLGIVLLTLFILLSPFLIAGAIFKRAGISEYTETVKSFLFPRDSAVSSENGRVNILILGKGGKGHEGADLTDTMIFASLSLTNHSITLISIPRDIWIPEIRAKINSAYYWGNLQPERGGGLPFSKQIVSKVTGQPVNYALAIDFSGFQDIIDTIGGVDVAVDTNFTDSKYPVAGKESDTCGGDATLACRYKIINFGKGIIHMDGAMALEYARSREGDNGENTDFARSARQQKVISAIKSKILSKGTLLNPFKLYKVWKVVRSSIETDMDFSSMIVLGREMLNVDGNIQSSAIPEGLLIKPPESQKYDYQYVFIPKASNWGEFQNWIKDLIK